MEEEDRGLPKDLVNRGMLPSRAVGGYGARGLLFICDLSNTVVSVLAAVTFLRTKDESRWNFSRSCTRKAG